MNAGNSVRNRAEGGYALVALLAASAILLASLALSIPRMAVQAQRTKEDRLIQIGKQYERAITLYYREHQKYPQELDDLEDTDGVRYLRRRYADPLGETGKWRLIHMGTDGQFEDSLLYDTAKDRRNRRAGEFPGAAFSPQGEPPTGFGQSNRSGTGPAAGGLPGQQDRQASRASVARESAAPDLAQRYRYNQGFEFEASGGPPSQPEVPGEPSDYSRMLPSEVPMDENDPGAAERPEGSEPSLGSGPFPTALGFQRPGPPGSSPSRADPAEHVRGSGASRIINRLLTSPQTGRPATTAPQQQAAQVFERGIAGVASLSEETGVMVYKGREAHNEWEFVYDYREDSKLSSRQGAPQDTTTGATAPGRFATRPGTAAR